MLTGLILSTPNYWPRGGRELLPGRGAASGCAGLSRQLPGRRGMRSFSKVFLFGDIYSLPSRELFLSVPAPGGVRSKAPPDSCHSTWVKLRLGTEGTCSGGRRGLRAGREGGGSVGERLPRPRRAVGGPGAGSRSAAQEGCGCPTSVLRPRY